MVPKFVLDTNLYIAADRDPVFAEELAAFYGSFLPYTFFHAVVAQELLLGAINEQSRAEVRRGYIRPFEARRRVITATFAAWARSGEVAASLIRAKVISRTGFTRSFLNDVLLATSCRELGVTLVTQNLEDFERIRRVERFDFTAPWPRR
ncbi:MAG: type II toxin-antitoxin system VapC family toxin [Gemmatimonadota bacterium]